jgi:hypothetical protein
MFVLQERQMASAAGWLLSVSKTLCDEDREYTIFLGDYRIVSFFVSSTLGVARINPAVSLSERKNKYFFLSTSLINCAPTRLGGWSSGRVYSRRSLRSFLVWVSCLRIVWPHEPSRFLQPIGESKSDETVAIPGEFADRT